MKRYALLFCLLLTACAAEESDWQRPYVDQPMGGVDAAVAAWMNEPAQTGGVLFIGDSITAGWPPDLLPAGARNRGIPGDGTQGVLYRLWFHIQEAPDAIVLMIGVNNFLYGQTASAHLDIDEILTRLADTPVYLLSVLPTDREDRSNDVIRAMNQNYRQVCSGHENCTFLDLYDQFAAPLGGGPAYTYDGLHLRRDGYEKLLLNLYDAKGGLEDSPKKS